MHKCDNPTCVNPSHLATGTIADNNKDKVSKGRQAKGSKNGRSILKGIQVKRIRELHQNSEFTYNELANQFGVSPHTIRAIIKEKIWKLPLAE